MADNSRLMSDEALRKELAQLEGEFEPGKWSGTVEDVYQAYAGLAEGLVRNFPDELKFAMADYDRGQFDAKTREIVYGINKHMATLRPEQQWGSQHAIRHAKSAAARDLIEDPGYREQRSEFQAALTSTNERHLDMIYEAERQTLQTLGLDPDHSPDGSKQSQRMQANLDLAEQYSDYRHNLEAFATSQAALAAAIGESREVEGLAPEAEKTTIERIADQIDKYKQSLTQNGFDRREYDFQLTRGNHEEWEQRIHSDLVQDQERLEQLSAREEKGFLRLIAKLDEAARDEEREEFEATGQPDPGERLAREAERGAFYIEAVKQFIVHQMVLQHVREEALSLQYDENAHGLDQAHRPDLEGVVKALEEAQAGIQEMKPPRVEEPAMKRRAAGGITLDDFHSLVMAGRENDRERED